MPRDPVERRDLRVVHSGTSPIDRDPTDRDPTDRDPTDALSEVLAGPDGDLAHARDIARNVVETGTVPATSPAAWLHGVLDEQQDRAQPVTTVLETHTWQGDRLGWVAESQLVLARVEAERAILALHDGAHECPDATEGCIVVRWLAYGHRFDAEGWIQGWSPTIGTR